MHFEILVEDVSGKEMLNLLLPKILPEDRGDTFKVISYKGIGSIPKGLKTSQNASKRALLNQLPRLLQGYGKTFKSNRSQFVVIVVCDLDNKDFRSFLNELNAVVDCCTEAPQVSFCLAIEEGEAWLLGDIPAIISAYPNAKKSVLNSYVNDSICGTWEKLADAVYKGGANKLNKLGRQEIGIQKSIWALSITPHMDVSKNKSPSFNHFIFTFLYFIHLFL